MLCLITQTIDFSNFAAVVMERNILSARATSCGELCHLIKNSRGREGRVRCDSATGADPVPRGFWCSRASELFSFIQINPELLPGLLWIWLFLGWVGREQGIEFIADFWVHSFPCALSFTNQASSPRAAGQIQNKWKPKSWKNTVSVIITAWG